MQPPAMGCGASWVRWVTLATVEAEAASNVP
jgi:hypothetical protein